MFLFQPHQVIYLDLKSLLYYNYCLKINIHNISGLTKGFVSVKISSRLYIQRCKYTHSLLASVCTFVSKVKLLFCDKKKNFQKSGHFHHCFSVTILSGEYPKHKIHKLHRIWGLQQDKGLLPIYPMLL